MHALGRVAIALCLTACGVAETAADAGPRAPSPEEACYHGEAAACAALAEVAARAGELERATARRERACELAPEDHRVAGACYALALTALDAVATEADPERAAPLQRRAGALARRACTAGHAEACYLAATARLAPTSPQRAREWLQLACDGGVVRACAELAARSMDRPREAATLFARACDAGVGVACGRLARMRFEDVGVPYDPGEAVLLATRACEHEPIDVRHGGAAVLDDDAGARDQSCADLGAWLGMGPSLAERDAARAGEVLLQACIRGADVCESLVSLTMTGSAVPHDAARDGLARACRTSDGACAALRRLYLEARAPTLAPPETRQALDAACERDRAQCGELARMARLGRGLELDAERAGALAERYCAGAFRFEDDRVVCTEPGSGALVTRRASAPVIRMGAPQISYSLPPAVLARFVRHQSDAVELCFDAEREQHPDAAGVLSVSFTVLADGRTTGARVSQATGTLSPRAEECVVRAVSELVMPPSGGGTVSIVYPFELEAR